MSTLVKKWIIQICVLVGDVAEERFKLCPDNPATSTNSRCCNPVQVVHATPYPPRKSITPTFFCNGQIYYVAIRNQSIIFVLFYISIISPFLVQFQQFQPSKKFIILGYFSLPTLVFPPLPTSPRSSSNHP